MHENHVYSISQVADTLQNHPFGVHYPESKKCSLNIEITLISIILTLNQALWEVVSCVFFCQGADFTQMEWDYI